MSSLSLANPPLRNPDATIDLVENLQGVLSFPAASRRRVFYWNPTQHGSDDDGMNFPEKGVMTGRRWSQAVVATRRAGSEDLIPYFGIRGSYFPETDPLLDDALRPWKDSPMICVDNITEYNGYTDGISLTAARTRAMRLADAVLRAGKILGCEANGKGNPEFVQWMFAQSGRAVPVFEWWLDPDTSPNDVKNRVGVSEWLDHGIRPWVLVARKSNRKGMGYPNLPDSDWPAVKVQIAKEFRDRGCEVVVRPVGLTPEQVAEIA